MKMHLFTAGLILPILCLSPPPGRTGAVRAESGPADGGSGSTGGSFDITPEPPAPSPSPCAGRPGLAPPMVVIPPGRFLVGSPPDEPDRSEDEGPRHRVTIPRPFALGRCEVTVGEFRRFVEDTGHLTDAERGGCYLWTGADWKRTAGRNWRNPGFEQTDEHPVVCVSHRDAEAYARWLSQRTGAPYRLPTEAEWEYAARAGAPTAYPWGADARGQTLCAHANGGDRSFLGEFPVVLDCEDGFVHTAPAGTFRANGFGLYDLIGNVLEWTLDCWHGSYEGAPDDGGAWGEEAKGDCGRRVVRGGSWMNDSRTLRSAYRFSYATGEAIDNLGFRVLRPL